MLHNQYHRSWHPYQIKPIFQRQRKIAGNSDQVNEERSENFTNHAGWQQSLQRVEVRDVFSIHRIVADSFAEDCVEEGKLRWLE